MACQAQLQGFASSFYCGNLVNTVSFDRIWRVLALGLSVPRQSRRNIYDSLFAC